jgi:D-alanine-D-alanine ligase
MNFLPSLASQVLDNAERDPKKYGKVAVLMGGYAEYEVSLQSGGEILKALQEKGVDAHEVLVRSDNGWLKNLLAQNFDRVFIALHGRVGEDGTVQGALEIAGLPYIGSDVCASAIAMHKVHSKQIWQTLGYPVIPFALVDEKTDIKKLADQFGLPMAVKPSRSGSTLGVTKLEELGQFATAYAEAKSYDSIVIVEPWITGVEYAVAIIDRYALPSIRIEPKQGYYDYNAKYVDDTSFFCPSGLADADEKTLRMLTEQAYLSLGCTGFGRADFIRDKNGKFWLMEINTIPGMTSHSLLPMAVKTLGYTFGDMLLAILTMTLKS